MAAVSVEARTQVAAMPFFTAISALPGSSGMDAGRRIMSMLAAPVSHRTVGRCPLARRQGLLWHRPALSDRFATRFRENVSLRDVEDQIDVLTQPDIYVGSHPSDEFRLGGDKW